MLQSSTGAGLKLRITSFALLLVPLINVYLQKQGIALASDSVESFIDAVFVVFFAIFHIWGWIRATWFKPLPSK